MSGFIKVSNSIGKILRDIRRLEPIILSSYPYEQQKYRVLKRVFSATALTSLQMGCKILPMKNASIIRLRTITRYAYLCFDPSIPSFFKPHGIDFHGLKLKNLVSTQCHGGSIYISDSALPEVSGQAFRSICFTRSITYS